MKRIFVLLLFIELYSYAECFSRGTPVWVVVNDACQKASDASSFIDGLNLCGFTPIGQADLLITTSGNYCLMQDVVGTVTIADSYVHLNLNGYTIEGGLQGVLVQKNLHDISIANGVVQNSEQEGVLVSDGCKRVAVTGLSLIACGTTTDAFGVNLAGDIKFGISECTVSDVTITQGANGVQVTSGFNNCLRNIQVTDLISNNSVTGISISSNSAENAIATCFISTVSSTSSSAQGIALIGAQNTSITDVKVVNLVGDSEVYGFYTRNCSGTSLQTCYAGDIESYGLGIFGGAGFWLESDKNYRISDCVSRGVRGKTHMLGMLLLGTQNGEVRSCSVSDVFSDGAGVTVYGFVVATLGEQSIGILVDDVTVQNIRAAYSGAQGFSINEETLNMVISNCSVQDVFGFVKTYGFFITDVPGVSISNCTSTNVQDLNPSGGAAIGFEMSSLNCGLMRDCISTHVYTLNGSTSGFHLAGIFKCVLQNCISSCVSSTNGGAIGVFLENASAMTITGCESVYNETQDTAMTASGFMALNSNDILFDFCLTQSNSIDPLSTGFGYGFNLQNCQNIQILNSTSVMNDDAAFFVDATSSGCLVRNCVGKQSGQGFTDFASTNTLIENVATFNGPGFDTTNNYIGVPISIVSSLGDPVTVGTNISA